MNDVSQGSGWREVPSRDLTEVTGPPPLKDRDALLRWIQARQWYMRPRMFGRLDRVLITNAKCIGGPDVGKMKKTPLHFGQKGIGFGKFKVQWTRWPKVSKLSAEQPSTTSHPTLLVTTAAGVTVYEIYGMALAGLLSMIEPFTVGMAEAAWLVADDAEREAADTGGDPDLPS
jgi:hypothetical protein